MVSDAFGATVAVPKSSTLMAGLVGLTTKTTSFVLSTAKTVRVSLLVSFVSSGNTAFAARVYLPGFPKASSALVGVLASFIHVKVIPPG